MTPLDQITQRLAGMQAKIDAATKGPWHPIGKHKTWLIPVIRTDVPALLSALREAVEALEDISESHDRPENDHVAREALASIATRLTP